MFAMVTPRERRVSRNQKHGLIRKKVSVTPRERRVSRNNADGIQHIHSFGHASREACE